jgi:hemerythrin
MPLMTWNAALSVGHPEMDRQHKHLVDLVNQLHEQMLSGEANASLGELLDKLLQYAASHFAAEERLMAQSNYPGLAAHRLEHEDLARRASAFRDEWKNRRVALSVHVSRFLKDWLQAHILGSDRKYTAFVNAQKAKHCMAMV